MALIQNRASLSGLHISTGGGASQRFSDFFFAGRDECFPVSSREFHILCDWQLQGPSPGNYLVQGYIVDATSGEKAEVETQLSISVVTHLLPMTA